MDRIRREKSGLLGKQHAEWVLTRMAGGLLPVFHPNDNVLQK
jgi:hypothetical protein